MDIKLEIIIKKYNEINLIALAPELVSASLQLWNWIYEFIALSFNQL